MPNFNPEKPFGEKFTCDNDTQSGFVSLFSDLALMDNPPTGEDLIQELKEAMTPLYLVDPDISKKLPIYGKVKAFLERFGVQVTVTNESGNLVAKRLICRIWNDPEFVNDRNDAFELFDNFRNGNRDLLPRSPTSPTNEETNTNQYASLNPSSRQLSNDVAKRFSNENSKFSGASSECWPKHVESYTRMSVELELSDEMKQKFFHHLLCDFALEYYRDNIENKVSSFQEILNKMNSQFCTSVKMEAVARKLDAIHISHYEDTEHDEEKALREISKTIQDLSPQTPKECQTDRHRKNILFNATRGREWALNVSSSSNFHKLSYQELLHELENSLQQYKIHKAHDPDEQSSYRSDRIHDINFTGQGRYQFNQKRNLTDKQINNRLNRCWNCNKPNCSVNRCKYPRNEKKIRLNRIKHFEAKNGRLSKDVTEALFQFTEDYFEDQSDASSASESNDSESEKEDTTATEVHHLLVKNKKEHIASKVNEDF